MRPSNDSVILQEILNLGIQIASLKHDYQLACQTGKCFAYKQAIAGVYADLEFQKRCLEMRDYKSLPYNIKLLYNKGPQKNVNEMEAIISKFTD
jgi:hypothetical protein